MSRISNQEPGEFFVSFCSAESQKCVCEGDASTSNHISNGTFMESEWPYDKYSTLRIQWKYSHWITFEYCSSDWITSLVAGWESTIPYSQDLLYALKRPQYALE